MRKLTTTLCMTIAVLLGMTGSGISTDFENRVKTERQKIIAALSPISTKRHCPADEMWRETLLETRGYFFRTKLPPLYYRIGDTGNNDNTKPYCNTIVKINPKSQSKVGNYLTRPKGWKMVWSSGWLEDSEGEGSIWSAVPPNNSFICLGNVVQKGFRQPDVPRYRCIHKRYLNKKTNNDVLWTNDGGELDEEEKNVTIFKLKRSGLLVSLRGIHERHEWYELKPELFQKPDPVVVEALLQKSIASEPLISSSEKPQKEERQKLAKKERRKKTIAKIGNPSSFSILEAKNFIADLKDFGKKYPQKIDSILIATHFAAAIKETTGMEYTASSSAFFSSAFVNLALGMAKNKKFIDFHIEAKKQRQEMERIERKKLRAAIEKRRNKISQRIKKNPFSEGGPKLVWLLKTYPLPDPTMPSREIRKKYQKFLKTVTKKKDKNKKSETKKRTVVVQGNMKKEKPKTTQNKIKRKTSYHQFVTIPSLEVESKDFSFKGGDPNPDEGIISQYWSGSTWQDWFSGKKFKGKVCHSDLDCSWKKDTHFKVKDTNPGGEHPKLSFHIARIWDGKGSYLGGVYNPTEIILFNGVSRVSSLGDIPCDSFGRKCLFVYQTRDNKEKLVVHPLMSSSEKRKIRFLSSESHILNTKTKSFLHAPFVDEKIRQLVRKKEIVNRIERCPSKWKNKSYPYNVTYICARALTLDESGFDRRYTNEIALLSKDGVTPDDCKLLTSPGQRRLAKKKNNKTFSSCKAIALWKKYKKRKKTLLETVFNYASFGSEQGLGPINFATSFWIEREKCTLERLSKERRFHRFIFVDRVDLRQVNETAFRIETRKTPVTTSPSEWNKQKLVISGGDTYYVSTDYKLIELSNLRLGFTGSQLDSNPYNVSLDRLKKAWGLAFKQCPGKRSAF